MVEVVVEVEEGEEEGEEEEFQTGLEVSILVVSQDNRPIFKQVKL